MSESEKDNAAAQSAAPPARAASRAARIDLGDYLRRIAEDRALCAGGDTNLNAVPESSTAFSAAVVEEFTAPRGTGPADFARLAARRSWRELITLTEHAMADPNTDATAARVWWVHAQLQAGAMPCSILAAPLESASSEILKRMGSPDRLEQGLLSLTEKTLLEAAGRLTGPHDSEMALLFMERAYRINPKNGEGLAAAVHAGVQELEQRRARHAEPEKLARMKALQAEIESAAAAAPAQSEKVQAEKAPRRRGWSVAALALLAAAAILLYGDRLGIRGLARWVQAKAAGASPSFEQTLYGESAPRSRMPELARLTPPLQNTLGGILRDLDSLERGRSAAAKPVEAPPPAERQVVRASGPVEPSSLARLIDEPPRPSPTRAEERGGLFEAPKAPPIAPEPRTPSPAGIPIVLYEIDAAAEVYPEPRDGAVPIEHLRPGDRVRVAGFKAGWAKIVSQAGRAAYVPASAIGRQVG